ncbi:MAG: zinc-binding protein [Gallionellales bacterium CG03_land_8_20_14_0_80_55_15]|nr:MAG: zinc-binding protein [Gallionellales bacterium CG03_land_8_20_14_0_80_55_15]
MLPCWWLKNYPPAWDTPKHPVGCFGVSHAGFNQGGIMEAKELKQLASGRWKSIVTSLAPQLGLAIERLPHHVSCPVHGGVDGFRLFKDFDETGGGVCNTCGIYHDGYSLLMWANGWDFKTTHHALQELLVAGNSNNRHPTKTRPAAKKENEVDVQSIRDSLNHVWKHSIPISSPLARSARMYFANRGIGQIDYRKIDETMIRFSPSLEYYEDGKMVKKYPAIVTMVCDSDGRPSTIHRTYITNNGTKAPVQSPKKMMRHCANDLFGAMRIGLAGNSKVLAVTEGVETALAVMSAFKIPVWAAGNAYLLENFVPPKGVDVVVYADKDRPSKQHQEGHGQSSAKVLLKRLWSEGVKASIKIPENDIPQGMKSVDWLDVINGVVDQTYTKKTAVR